MRNEKYDKFMAFVMAIYFSIYQFSFSIDVGLLLLVTGGMILLSSNNGNDELNSLTFIPDFLVFVFSVIVLLYSGVSEDRKLNLILTASFFPAVLAYINISRSRTNEKYFIIAYCGIFLGSVLSSLIILFYGVKLKTLDPEILIKNFFPSFFVVPNDFILIAICLPFILAFIVRKRSLVVLYSAGFLICVAAILVSHSRSAIAIAIFSIYFFFAMHKKSFFPKTIFAIFLFFVIFEIIGSSSFLSRIKNYNVLCETRIPLWVAAWNLWTEDIFFGHGAYSFVKLYQQKIEPSMLAACSLVDKRLTPWPHNLYLEVLSNYGLIGAIPFFLLVFWMLKTSYQSTKMADDSIRPIAIGNFVAIIGFVLAGFVELTFLRYWVVVLMFAIFGISVALEILNRQNKGLM